jgi:uncharacterized protein YeaO (DUF488 family)
MAPKSRRTIKLKRAYDQPGKNDGLRILVDRIWPRGVATVSARIDLWLKELAPSTELRKWFGHDPVRWVEFRERYFRELEKNARVVAELEQQIGSKPVTLVFGARDEQQNNAVALKEFLERRRKFA